MEVQRYLSLIYQNCNFVRSLSHAQVALILMMLFSLQATRAVAMEYFSLSSLMFKFLVNDSLENCLIIGTL